MSTDDITTNVGQNVTTWVNAISNQTWQQMLMFIVIIVVGIIGTRVILKLENRLIEKSSNLNTSLRSLIRNGTKFLLYFIMIVTAASVIGIPITSFVAIFSVLALAVSLAIQGLLSNLAGSLIIMVTKPFKDGDYIEISGSSGTVTKTGLMQTELLSPQGYTVYLPNSTLYTTGLTNYTAYGKRRTDIPISASYDNTPAEVEAACLEAVRGIAKDEKFGMLQDPAPEIILDSYGDSAINYIIRFWSRSDTWYAAKTAINHDLYRTFKEHNVEMTYPHLNVHMQK